MSTVIEEFVAKLGWDIDTKTLSTFQRQVAGIRDTTRHLFYGSVAAGGAIVMGIRKVMQSFSMIEDAEAAFTPLLGGAERATEMVEKLNKAAAATPFEFQNLADATKQLLPMMDGDIQRTLDTVNMLGDTAGGKADKMQSVVRGFSRVLIKGRADMESLNIIAEAGIPVYKQMQEVLGFKTGQQMFDAMRQGKISVEDVTKTFKTMTSEGGIFFRGMEIASKTFSGRMSTMKDEIGMTLAEIGKAIAPLMKQLLDDGIEQVSRLREWAKANREIIRSGFTRFMGSVVSAFKMLVGFARGVKELVDSVGGLGNALKIVAGTFATIKLASIAVTMSEMLKTAPSLAAAFVNIAKSGGAAWLGFATIIGGTMAVMDDANETLKGNRSALNRYVINPALRAFSAYGDLGPQAQKAAKMMARAWQPDFMKGGLLSTWTGALDVVFFDWAAKLGSGIRDIVWGFWDVMTDIATTALGKIWSVIKGIFSGWSAVGNLIKSNIHLGRLERVKEDYGYWAGKPSGPKSAGFEAVKPSEPGRSWVNPSAPVQQSSKQNYFQPMLNITIPTQATDPKGVAREVEKAVPRILEKTYKAVWDNMVTQNVGN